ncbi:MAG: SDR family oxidoreductase, partial [Bacteroidota bacterium]
DGIGKQTALSLSGKDSLVIIHGRSESKCRQTVDEILTLKPDAEVEFVTADLSLMKNVRSLADDLKRRYDHLDVLLNNAGVFMNHHEMTTEGFEMTFAVNHLAPFHLTNELLPLLKATPASRIVTVSSIAHRNGRNVLADLNSKRSFSGYSVYASSKLMNVLFTIELAERLNGTGITANCLHPGVVGTKLLKTGFNGMNGSDSLEAGAETSVYLSTSTEVEGVTGKYFVRKKISPVSAAADDESVRKQLWEMSDEFCRM